VRYRVGDAELSNYVCPPYDVINDAEREALLNKSADNIVAIELPSGGDGRYDDAAAHLAKMLASGLLLPDKNNCFYVYRMDFTTELEPAFIEGVVGRLKLEPVESGVVLPHEGTYKHAKSDRFELMKSTAANISPIYSLFSDPLGEVRSMIRAAAERVPAASVTVDGVTHSIYPVRGNRAKQMTDAFLEKTIIIADGHHRYETALNYKAWREQLGEIVDDSHPASYIMTACMPLEQSGLTIFPTHRALLNPAGFDRAALFGAIRDVFEITEVEGRSARQALGSRSDPNETSFLYYDGAFCLLKLRPQTDLSKLMPEKSDALRKLDVSVLHSLVIDGVLSGDLRADAAQIKVFYTRDFDEATELVDSGAACCAFFLRPTKVSEVAAIASGGERMPQKSTYFYPKLLTGLVINKM